MLRTIIRHKSWLIIALVIVTASRAAAQTTPFTYQGKLTDAGAPANGSYDFEFRLLDALTSGHQIGATNAINSVQVTNGGFTVQLDFGLAAFGGPPRFLEISVRPSGGPSFTLLAPRQQITSTPYTIRSLNSGIADALSIACVSCVTSSQIASVSGSAVTGTIPVASVPTGSANYVQNATTLQASSNCNINGNGTAGGTPLAFMASAGGDADARAAKPRTEQATKKAIATPRGVVVGTLTLNGKVIKLRYIYARRRVAPPPDDVRLHMSGEKPKGGVVDVIVTNQPLSEDILTRIQENKYHGSDKVRGIDLIIESSGEHSWVTYFLLQSGTVPQGGMTDSRGAPKIENGRIRGKIEYKNEDVLDVRTYSISFDAPLKE